MTQLDVTALKKLYSCDASPSNELEENKDKFGENNNDNNEGNNDHNEDGNKFGDNFGDNHIGDNFGDKFGENHDNNHDQDSNNQGGKIPPMPNLKGKLHLEFFSFLIFNLYLLILRLR